MFTKILSGKQMNQISSKTWRNCLHIFQNIVVNLRANRSNVITDIVLLSFNMFTEEKWKIDWPD